MQDILTITRYHGNKRNREGTLIANDSPIISGLSGDVTITVYKQDENCYGAASGYTKIRMTKESARQLSEVERQDKCEAKKTA